MRIIDIEDLAEDFDRLIEEAAEGSDFIISVAGVPKAKVVTASPPAPDGSDAHSAATP